MDWRITVRASLAAFAVLLPGAFATRALLAGRASTPTVTGVPRAPDSAARGASTVHPSLAGLSVSQVTGPVERRTGPTDPWRPVRPGDTISASESLRALPGGAAVLELQDHTSVWLWPESEVTAERLDDELARLGVSGGRLDLTVPAREGRRVEVAAPGGATAIALQARFSIIVDGAHVATVATREGEVDVVSGTGRVRVPPGMQTRARPGDAPEIVEAIPAALLLEVDWPSAPLRTHTATLRGRAPAGVLVSVGGTRVVVADDGTFSRDVHLDEGENHLDVTADDAAGRHVVRRSPTLRVDTRPPSVGTHGQWE